MGLGQGRGGFAFGHGLKAGPSPRAASRSRAERLGSLSPEIREGPKAPCVPGQGCRGVFRPGCSGLDQTRVLFSLSSFSGWLLSALCQAPRRPDRRDENELSSSAEEKIRERDGGKVREIKQK